MKFMLLCEFEWSWQMVMVCMVLFIETVQGIRKVCRQGFHCKLIARAGEQTECLIYFMFVLSFVSFYSFALNIVNCKFMLNSLWVQSQVKILMFMCVPFLYRFTGSHMFLC